MSCPESPSNSQEHTEDPVADPSAIDRLGWPQVIANTVHLAASANPQAVIELQHYTRALFDQALDAMVVADDAGIYVDVNPAACELFGLSRDQILGQAVADFIPPPDQASQIWQEFLQTGQLRGELALQLPDGSTRQVEYAATANVLPGLHLSVLRDITAYKQTQAELTALSQTLDQRVRDRTQALEAANAELRHQKSLMTALFSQSLDSMFFMILDAPLSWTEATNHEAALDYAMTHARITQVNDALASQYRTSRDTLHGMTPADFFAYNLDYGREVLRQLFTLGHSQRELEKRRFDGTPMWIEGDYVCLYNEDGQITGLFGIQRDITQRRTAAVEAQKREQEFRALVENSPDMVSRVDPQGRFLYVNPMVECWSNIPMADYLGKTSFELGFPNQVAELWHNALDRVVETRAETFLEYDLELPGGVRSFHSRVVPEFGVKGEVDTMLVVVRDVTDLMQAQHTLEQLAHLDGLTQIANRRRFDQHLQQQWQQLCRDRSPLAIVLCDVDSFKAYNDHLGHLTGDDCLRQLAKALDKGVQRPMDLVARYGGEEFVIVLPNTSTAGAVAVVERLQAAIAALAIPHPSSDIAPQITLSFGIASTIPQLGTQPDSLLNQADAALYRAKLQGRNRYVIADAD
jgi:diguanylate cyclase (GGDEF)-like protein/PAS domain S-box-containing protein